MHVNKENKSNDFEIVLLGGTVFGNWDTWAAYNIARAIGNFRLNHNHMYFQHLLRRLEEGQITGDTLKSLGSQMFKSLFSGDIGKLFELAKRSLTNSKLRIQINIVPTFLHKLPWEFLYDDAGFLVIQHNVSIIRKIPTLNIHNKRVENGPVKILVGMCNPKTDRTTRLRLEREAKFVKEGLRGLEELGLVKCEIVPSIQSIKFEIETRKHYDIFHFMGHAHVNNKNNKGYLQFVDGPYDGEMLATRLVESGVRFAILNACDTGKVFTENSHLLSIGHSLIKSGIPIVLAMQSQITDKYAIMLSQVLYSEMAAGEYVDWALARARQRICSDTGTERIDWGIPVLLSTDPSNLLLLSNFSKKRSGAGTLPGGRTTKIFRTYRNRRVVGLCDIDSMITNLDSLVEKMNRSQDYFNFQIIPGFYSVELLESYKDKIYLNSPKAFGELSSILSRFKDKCGIQKLIGVTQRRIIDEEYAGLFVSNSSDQTFSVISTEQLDVFAAAARIKYEEGVMFLIIGALISLYTSVDYHEDTNGCVMDFCSNRNDLIYGLKKPKLDESCKSKISDNRILDAFLKMLGDLGKPDNFY